MLNELITAVHSMESEEELQTFFREIFTEKELKDLGLRWRLMKELKEGRTQRDIAARHHISLCKITRGSKILKNPDSVSLKYIRAQTGIH